VIIQVDSALDRILIKGGCWPGPPPDGPTDPYGTLTARQTLVRDILDVKSANSLGNRLAEILGTTHAIEMNLRLVDVQVGANELPTIKSRTM